MIRKFVLALLMCVPCGQCWSQLTVLPEDGMSVGCVLSPVVGKWIVISQVDFLPVPFTKVNDGKGMVFQSVPGKYVVFFFPPGDADPTIQVVVLGAAKPVPPGPDPPNPPIPPGVKWLLLVEESGKRTPQFGNLLVNLRKDPVISKVLWKTDPNATGPVVKPLIEQIPKGMELPVLITINAEGKAVSITAAPSSIEKYKELLK